MKQLFRRKRKPEGPQQLTLAEIDSILRNGNIGADEPFMDWLYRTTQVPRDDYPDQCERLAMYLHSIGLRELRWKQAGQWQKDERVSVTYLVAYLATEPWGLGKELDWLACCYEWE